jgi:hypothetical protein
MLDLDLDLFMLLKIFCVFGYLWRIADRNMLLVHLNKMIGGSMGHVVVNLEETCSSVKGR